MKTMLLLLILLLSLGMQGRGQTPVPSPAKLTNAASCVPRQTTKRIRRPTLQTSDTPPESAAEFFVGEATVEVTKDQQVVRLAMAQHASVLIELPANDGPRFIIPGDPEMVTVDEKALERNKRAIIVRPGSLFLVPLPHQKVPVPAATVTAQMRSGLVVTFLFYPVADLAQNVHRCVLSYKRDEVVARRRAAGLPVNLDQKEAGEKPAEPNGAPASISVEPAGEANTSAADPSNPTITPSTAKLTELNATPVLNVTPPLAIGTATVNERALAAAKEQLARATAEPQSFKNWTRPLHGLSLAVVQDGDLKEDFRVLLLAVRNAGTQPLKLIRGTPDLTLELIDAKGKVINVQSVKPLHIETTGSSGDVGAGQTIYCAVVYQPLTMSVRQRLKIVVAQTDAADEPASIALLK